MRRAAPALRSNASTHGYVSYEVSPLLANDTDGTIKAARRYWARIARPNVMIKVPSTPAGLPAIETLISEGLNINVTLMFSMTHYNNVAEAYIKGIEKRAQSGGAVDRIFSVASFFVSRVETLVDKKLDAKLKQKNDTAVAALKGKAAVANTKLVYQRYKEIFLGERFAAIKKKGARTTVAALGFDRHEEPCLQRRQVCRGAHRTRHRQHDAAGDDGRVSRPWQGGRDARGATR